MQCKRLENVSIGNCDIDPIVLGTSGVSSCIAAVVELENKIFIYHSDPSSFNATTTCSQADAYNFLMRIFAKLDKLDAFSMVKNVCLIGGWNDIGYVQLRSQIDLIREDYVKTMNENRTLLYNNFPRFVNAIKLNLISFNVPSKTPNGKNKEPNDDDNANDYVFDSTIVYYRWPSSSIFAVWQYGGREHEMFSKKNQSLLLATYVINPTFDHLQAFISSNAVNSPYFREFSDQLLINVKSTSDINQSFVNEVFKKTLDDLLSRFEAKVTND